MRTNSLKVLRMSRLRMVRAAAPRMAPGMEPIPPRITMARMVMEARRVKDSGETKVRWAP